LSFEERERQRQRKRAQENETEGRGGDFKPTALSETFESINI